MSRFGSIAGLLVLALAGCQSSVDCPTGTTRCGDACVATDTERDCGGCAIACGPGLVCRAGECACRHGLLPCAGRCVDPASDPAHCGACDVACGEADCVRGRCSCASGELCGGTCVDTSDSERHCGACGTECVGDRSCVGGECQCPAGAIDCGSACVDPRVDTGNCGGCGVVCPADRACLGGACVCRAGTPCPGGCRDLTSDETSCGACGVACAAIVGDVCREGRCVPRLEWVRGLRAAPDYRHQGGIAHAADVVYVTSGFSGEVVIGGARLADTDRRDVFLGALAASGGAGLWLAGFGGLDDDDTHSIVATPGAVTISGRFDQTVDFGGETRVPTSSYEDSFVARYGL